MDKPNVLGQHQHSFCKGRYWHSHRLPAGLWVRRQVKKGKPGNIPGFSKSICEGSSPKATDVTIELEYISYSELEIWLKDGSREYIFMVTFQGGEKSAMLFSRNVWVYCCFTQYLCQWPGKGDALLDGVKLSQVIKCCVGEKNSRRPYKTG